MNQMPWKLSAAQHALSSIFSVTLGAKSPFFMAQREPLSWNRANASAARTASLCCFKSAAFFALVALLYMPGCVVALLRSFGIALCAACADAARRE